MPQYIHINATLQQIKQMGTEFKMSYICIRCSLGKWQELASYFLSYSSDSALPVTAQTPEECRKPERGTRGQHVLLEDEQQHRVCLRPSPHTELWMMNTRNQ